MYIIISDPTYYSVFFVIAVLGSTEFIQSHLHVHKYGSVAAWVSYHWLHYRRQWHPLSQKPSNVNSFWEWIWAPQIPPPLITGQVMTWLFHPALDFSDSSPAMLPEFQMEQSLGYSIDGWPLHIHLFPTAWLAIVGCKTRFLWPTLVTALLCRYGQEYLGGCQTTYCSGKQISSSP